MKLTLLTLGFCLSMAWGFPLPTTAQEITCKATRDTWISSVGGEADCNMGRAGTIKLKVYQEFGVIDFDVSALKGRLLEAAWLYVKPAGGHKWGQRDGTDLRVITLATVGKNWEEGLCTRYARDTKGFGATFNESSYSKADWGWPGAKLAHVSLGNMETIRCEGELEPQPHGWQRVPIDLRLVRALVAGATHGLLIMDGTTDVFMNCTIRSAQSRGSEPSLVVDTYGTDTQAPRAVRKVRTKPAPNWATAAHGAIEMQFTVPEDAFSYNVRIDGKPVDRWQIPFAAEANALQTFPLVDLPAGKSVELSVTAVDAAGNESLPAVTRVSASPRIAVPHLPRTPFRPKGGKPPALGRATVWAFPEVTKVDPVTGDVMHEVIPDIRARNAVWDAATGTVRLAAARGEIVSFQLAIEGEAKGVAVTVSGLAGPGTISSRGVKLWRNWYVNDRSEYALPWKGSADCPMADNQVAGQTLQAVTVDYHVPIGATAGDYRGTVTLKSAGAELVLPLKVKVYAVTIPETVFFNPELNCYSGPGKAGSEKFKDSHRVAHYNRCAINRVPYSQSGRTHADYVPQTDPGTGRVTDWAGFDRNLGGLLDGSWFKDNPRAGVPVATLYLPHYEGYPLDYQKYYKSRLSASASTREQMTMHHIEDDAPADALSGDYKRAFVANVRDFYAHFQAKGYTKTVCQMYMNNKGGKGGYALWTLDEPYKTVDWMALNVWAGLWKQAINDPDVYTATWHEAYFLKGGVNAMKRRCPTFLYRGDISRSLYQGSLCDGLMTTMYGGSGRRHLRNQRRRMPAILYTYGSCNSPEKSNWESAAWCLRAYTQYQDGVLPWQSLGGEDSLWNGDREGGGNALIVDTGKAGHGHAVASFRVHALRRGAQDCELLRLLQLKRGWSREHIEQIILQRVPIVSDHRVSEAASAVKFGSLTSRGFVELKEGVLRLLTGETDPRGPWTLPVGGAKNPAGRAEAPASPTPPAGARGRLDAVMVERGPAIDGTLADPTWQKCPPLILGDSDSRARGREETTARVLVGPTHLYVAWECAQATTGQLRSNATERDAGVWKDDCVELFVSADKRAGFRHFIINSKGVLQDTAFTRPKEEDAGWNSSAVVKTSIERNRRWVVTLSVPLTELGAHVGGNQTWTMNLNRTSQGPDIGQPVGEWSWAVLSSTDYHSISDFGKIAGVTVPKRDDGVTRKAEDPLRPITSAAGDAQRKPAPKKNVEHPEVRRLIKAITPGPDEEPYWLARMKKVRAEHVGEPGYVAQFGDSITYSMAFWSTVGYVNPTPYIPEDGLPTHPGGKRWRDIIRGVRDKGPENANYSGWRVGQLRGAIGNVLGGKMPEVAIIMIGSNDIRGRSVPPGYEAAVRSIVSSCMESGCIPILNTIPPMRGREKAAAEAARIVRGIARAKAVPLVDYYDAIMRLRPGRTWDNALVSRDGVHPTGGRAGDFSDANLRESGYALRTWLNFLMFRQVYFRVLKGAPVRTAPDPSSSADPLATGDDADLDLDDLLDE